MEYAGFTSAYVNNDSNGTPGESGFKMGFIDRNGVVIYQGMQKKEMDHELGRITGINGGKTMGKRWAAADAKESAGLRRLEKRYFRKKIVCKTILGIIIFGFGAGPILILYLTAFEESWGQVDPGSYITGMIIWSVLFLGGYGCYIYSLVRSHREFMKKSLLCRRVVCVGKELIRSEAYVDLMVRDGKILRGLAVPAYESSDIELHKPIYLVTTDPEAFYEQADIYPSPFEEKNLLDSPDAADFFFR